MIIKLNMIEDGIGEGKWIGIDLIGNKYPSFFLSNQNLHNPHSYF